MVYILALIADIYHIVTPIQVFGIIELPPDMPGFPTFFSSEALKSSCHPRSVYPFGKTNLFPLGFGIFSFSIFFNRGIILFCQSYGIDEPRISAVYLHVFSICGR